MPVLRAGIVVAAIVMGSLAGCRVEPHIEPAPAEIALAHLGPAESTPIFLGAGDRLGRDVYSAYLAQHAVEQMYAAE